MNNLVILNCLHQLIKVYAYAEQQYMHAAVFSTSPVLRSFAETKALERMDFIEEIYASIHNKSIEHYPKSYNELKQWQLELYGHRELNTWITSEGTSISADAKALEICHCLLKCDLPSSLEDLLLEQAIQVETGLSSVVYLKALFED
ncbi:MAG: hypothetical protein HKN31_13815 [Pricia sp.]|nr:hypothetical protein [Pricia sp.]